MPGRKDRDIMSGDSPRPPTPPLDLDQAERRPPTPLNHSPSIATIHQTSFLPKRPASPTIEDTFEPPRLLRFPITEVPDFTLIIPKQLSKRQRRALASDRKQASNGKIPAKLAPLRFTPSMVIPTPPHSALTTPAAASTFAALDALIPLTPMSRLDPLDTVYDGHGTGRRSEEPKQKKRKYRDGQEDSGLAVSAAPFKAGGSSYRPHGRALEIGVPKERKDSNKAKLHPEPALPSTNIGPQLPRKENRDLPSPMTDFDYDRPRTPSPVRKSSHYHPESPTPDVRTLQHRSRDLERRVEDLQRELTSAEERADKYNKRGDKALDQAISLEKDYERYKAKYETEKADCEAIRLALDGQTVSELQQDLEKAQKEAERCKTLAKGEKEKAERCRKETAEHRIAAEQATQQCIRLTQDRASLEEQFADAAFQLGALRTTFSCLPPVQTPACPSPLDFAALRKVLLSSKMELAKERNVTQSLQREVNRHISLAAVTAEEKSTLKMALQRANDARESSLISSGNKIALLNDEHEKLFAEMQAQMALMEDLKVELDAKDAAGLDEQLARESLEQEIKETKEALKQQVERAGWYKEEYLTVQGKHDKLKEEVEKAKEQTDAIVPQMEQLQAQSQQKLAKSSAGSSSDKWPEVVFPPTAPSHHSPSAPAVSRPPHVIPSNPRVNTLESQLNGAQSRLRSLTLVCADRDNEIARLKSALLQRRKDMDALQARCQRAEHDARKREHEAIDNAPERRGLPPPARKGSGRPLVERISKGPPDHMKQTPDIGSRFVSRDEQTSLLVTPMKTVLVESPTQPTFGPHSLAALDVERPLSQPRSDSVPPHGSHPSHNDEQKDRRRDDRRQRQADKEDGEIDDSPFAPRDSRDRCGSDTPSLSTSSSSGPESHDPMQSPLHGWSILSPRGVEADNERRLMQDDLYGQKAMEGRRCKDGAAARADLWRSMRAATEGQREADELDLLPSE